MIAGHRRSRGVTTGVQVARDGGWQPKPIKPSEVVERAVREVNPRPGDKASCRAEIMRIISFDPIEMYNCNDAVLTWHAFPNKNERRILTSLSKALGKACRAINSLPPEWQQVLFVDPEDRAAIVDGRILWPEAAKHLADFLRQHGELAERAAAYTRLKRTHFVSGPAENVRRGDAKKRHAANCAYDLLVRYRGAAPALTRNPFYDLASILYEAFTGKAGEDIERQCRAVRRHRRAQVTA
jgi:hypothetical protein